MNDNYAYSNDPDERRYFVLKNGNARTIIHTCVSWEVGAVTAVAPKTGGVGRCGSEPGTGGSKTGVGGSRTGVGGLKMGVGGLKTDVGESKGMWMVLRCRNRVLGCRNRMVGVTGMTEVLNARTSNRTRVRIA